MRKTISTLLSLAMILALSSGCAAKGTGEEAPSSETEEQPVYTQTLDVVIHDRGGDEVAIEFRGRRIEIPRDQIQWLAEVLLQVSDLYRVTWTEEGRDDYNRPDLLSRDRR